MFGALQSSMRPRFCLTKMTKCFFYSNYLLFLRSKQNIHLQKNHRKESLLFPLEILRKGRLACCTKSAIAQSFLTGITNQKPIEILTKNNLEVESFDLFKPHPRNIPNVSKLELLQDTLTGFHHTILFLRKLACIMQKNSQTSKNTQWLFDIHQLFIENPTFRNANK